jgi:hypothetical protein
MSSSSFNARMRIDDLDIVIKDGRVHPQLFHFPRPTMAVFYERPLFSSFYIIKLLCRAPGFEINFHKVSEDTTSCMGENGYEEIKL